MAAEEKRVALVIGNSAYAHASTLANPGNDARGIAAALTRIGFSGIAANGENFTTSFKTSGVTALADLEYNALRRALAAFGRAAEQADKAILYYAGHGIEVGGQNYLIPVDARLAHAKDVDFETASLMQVLGAVDGATGLRLVILDACRDNPFRARLFPGRELSRGLRAIEPTGNILVAYAAKHGTVAQDGKGSNSPYAAAILAHMEEAGLEIVDLFREVKDEVRDATDGQQEPYLYGSLGRRREYLVPPKVEVAAEAPTPSAPEHAPFDPVQVELHWWQRVKDRDDPGLLTEFLQRYPDGVFAPLALDRLAELEWGRLKASKSAADIEAFLQRWPGCRFETAARARLTALRRKTERTGAGVSGTVTAGVAVGVLALAAAGYAYWSASTPPTPQPSHIPATKQPSAAELADDKAFAAAQNDRSKAALEAYLKSDGRHAEEARTLLRKLDAAAYEAAERANTAVAFKGYRDEWPNGQYLGLAEQRIAALEAAAKVEAERKQAEERAQADEEAYTAAKSKGTKAALEAYLKKYSRHADDARTLLDTVAYKAAERANTVEAFEDYKDNWPNGQYFSQAGQRIAALEAAAATPRTGESFRDCADCPEMMVVPAGSFMMGDEGSQHKVTVKQPFAVGKFEVTFAEWDACVSNGGCKHKPATDWGRGRQPVMNVSWDDITKEYLPWLQRKTGKKYRLLSEAEWEYAARAGTTTAYSTGQSITKKQAQFSEGSWGSAGKTVEVGSFAANDFGLHDMHGNVWEWTEDCWNDNYNGAPTDGSARTTGECGRRVLRGGSWGLYPQYLRSAVRDWFSTGNRNYNSGFRLARTLPR